MLAIHSLIALPSQIGRSRGCEVHTESGDLLSVLDKLDTDTLPDSGVGLLGLNTDLLEHDSLGVGGATERRRLEGCAERPLLVSQIGPSLLPPVVAELAGGVQTTRLSFTHDCWLMLAVVVLVLLCLSDDRSRCSGGDGDEESDGIGNFEDGDSECLRGLSAEREAKRTDLVGDRGDGWLSMGLKSISNCR